MVTAAAIFIMALLVMAFNFALQSSLNNDADKILHARAVAALDTIEVRGGQIVVNERPQPGVSDVPIWVYDGIKSVERGPGVPEVQQLANELSLSPPDTREDPETETRILSLPIIEGGKRIGTVISALSIEPYERTQAKALLFSLAFAALVTLLIVGLTRLVVDRALGPVTEMNRAAAEWTEHDLDHRFNVGEPHDELTSLAATFDGMLDRIASSLRHEQRFSAEISHELRTPLAAILAEADLALRRERGRSEYREALDNIRTRATQLQRILEALLAAEKADRSANPEGATVESIIDRAVEAHLREATARGLELVSAPGMVDIRADVDVDLGERILSPLIENACRYAKTRVRVTSGVDTNLGIVISVSDDGSGISHLNPEKLFEPGYSEPDGRAESAAGSGAGLGLSLARRLARSVGGDIRVVDNQVGACFEIALPASRPIQPV